MRPVTLSFLEAMRGSHQRVVRATMCAPGQVGTTPVGTPWDGGQLGAAEGALGRIPILSGDVTADATADILATLSLSTVYPWPAAPTSFGNNLGPEIYVERGVTYANGRTEWVGLGYFRINDVDQDDPNGGPLAITGEDRMANIRDARPIIPIQFGSGASVSSVIEFVVNEVMPTAEVVYDFDAGTTLLQADYIMTDDRLGFLKDITSAFGKIMFWDYAGRLQVKDRPDPTKGSVYSVDAGRNGVLVSAKRTRTRDGVYNVVVANGQPTGELPPVSGFAVDDNPNSPTYIAGDFGIVPEYYTSQFLTTEDQCRAAAASMLLTATGLPYSVSLGSVPNPALEPSDVIAVSYNGHDPTEVHICDKISYPLDVSTPMNIDTRKQFL